MDERIGYGRWIAVCLACLLGLSLAAAAGECRCHDAPDAPCVRHWITLENIEVPYEDWHEGGYEESEFHDAIQDGSGDEEIWVMIEVVPSSCSSACGQIYVLYAPEQKVEDGDFTLIPGSGENEGSNVVFSMIECTPRSEYTIHIAIIEQDGSYDDAMELLSPWLQGHQDYDETGDPSGDDAEEHGWSLRFGRASDDHFAHICNGLLAESGDNDEVTGIRTLRAPGTGTTGPVTSTFYTNGPGAMQVTIQAHAEEIACDLACTAEEAARPTLAEQRMEEDTLEAAATAASTIPSGFTSKPAGAPGVPPRATGMTSKATSVTRATSSGGAVWFRHRTVVIRYEDDSIYVFWEELKVETDEDGRLVGWTRNRGDGASRAGSARSTSRGELTDARLRRYAGWGGSGSAPFTVSSPPVAPDPQDGPFATIEFASPAGATLDLSALSLDEGTGLLADGTIVLCADHLDLGDGRTLSHVASRHPEIHPGMEELRVLAPEAIPVLGAEDRLLVPVVNLSGTAVEVCVAWEDDRGWAAPSTVSLALGAGETGVVEVPLLVPGPMHAEGSVSTLRVVASACGLPTVSSQTLLVPSDTLDAPELAIVPAEEGLSEEIVNCTERIGEASGADYKASGFRRYRVPSSQLRSFFLDELEAYSGCPTLGECVTAVQAWVEEASAEDLAELVAIFWAAFQAANR